MSSPYTPPSSAPGPHARPGSDRMPPGYPQSGNSVAHPQYQPTTVMPSVGAVGGGYQVHGAPAHPPAQSSQTMMWVVIGCAVAFVVLVAGLGIFFGMRGGDDKTVATDTTTSSSTTGSSSTPSPGRTTGSSATATSSNRSGATSHSTSTATSATTTAGAGSSGSSYPMSQKGSVRMLTVTFPQPPAGMQSLGTTWVNFDGSDTVMVINSSLQGVSGNTDEELTRAYFSYAANKGKAGSSQPTPLTLATSSGGTIDALYREYVDSALDSTILEVVRFVGGKYIQVIYTNDTAAYSRDHALSVIKGARVTVG